MNVEIFVFRKFTKCLHFGNQNVILGEYKSLSFQTYNFIK